MLGDRGDVGPSDFSYEDLPLVGSIKVDVIGSYPKSAHHAMRLRRTDTSGDAGLQLLGLGNSLGIDVTRVEGSGNDDFSIDDFLVEGRVFAFLVVGDNQGVALGLEPFADAELILNCAEQSRLVVGPFAAFVENCKNFNLNGEKDPVSGLVSQGNVWGKVGGEYHCDVVVVVVSVETIEAFS
jgi:hypothetical protein